MWLRVATTKKRLQPYIKTNIPLLVLTTEQENRQNSPTDNGREFTAMTRFIAYTRVSTKEQGLGLDAQASRINEYIRSVGGEQVAAFSEKESGAHDDRPELAKAIAACKEKGATLIVAKLDRLSRRVVFLFEVVESLRSAGVDIVVAEMPELVRDTMSLAVFAGLAQKEREMISDRTRQALSALREKGVNLGRPAGCDTSAASAKAGETHKAAADAWAQKTAPVVVALRNSGMPLLRIAETMNAQGLKTRRGGTWTATAVKRVLERIEYKKMV